MKLYKFMTLDMFKAFVDDPSLRITPHWEQNDPYELSSLSEQTASKHLHGIISLSSELFSPTMWAYYGDNHQGVALEFEVDEEHPYEIFASSCPPASASDHSFSKVDYPDSPGSSYFHKSSCWKHENEYRYILPFTSTNKIIVKDDMLEMFESTVGFPIRTEPSTNDYLILNRATIDYIKRLRTEDLSAIFQLQKEREIMFFTRINLGTPGRSKSPIRSIIFGSKLPSETARDVIIGKKDEKFIERFYSVLDGNYKGISKIDWGTNPGKESLRSLFSQTS